MARKILLADDSVTAQNMGRKILADAGYDVATVNNGSAALKRVAELQPDLIVLDVYMPGYSGLEVCQRLKGSDETAHIPVLLSVGKLEPFKLEEARRVRADAHIVKPFEASELLAAITRLEDLLAAQPGNGIHAEAVDSGSDRFRSAGNHGKSESSSGDTGWKSRLGFASKKKKDEKDEKDEVDDAAAGAFRDFRKGKHNGASEVPRVKQASRPEPVPVTSIPRDITPDELDALSALAAKLERPISMAEKVASLTDNAAQEKTAIPVAPPTVVSAGTIAVEAAVPEVQAVRDLPVVAAPVVEAPAPESPIAQEAVLAVEGRSEIEIPVEHVELAPENVGIVAQAAVATDQLASGLSAQEYSASHASENQSSENQPSESPPSPPPPAETLATVNAGLFVQEPACVDRDDEPMFASAASAAEQAMREAAPSDEELVQALRLLTPANGNVDTCAAHLQGTLEATDRSGNTAAREESSEWAFRPRWVAERVALSPEEAATSLEEEMFRTLAATPATTPCNVLEPAGFAGIAAIEASVEHMLAAVDATAKTLPEALQQSLPEQETPHSGELDWAQRDSAPHDSGPPRVEAKAEEPKADEPKVDEPAVAEERVAPADMASLAPAPIMDAGPAGHAEAATPGQPAPDDAPKAKAAAAAAESGESSSAPDASTIASIVDRVMADLRPKIVEEITKKLGAK